MQYNTEVHTEFSELGDVESQGWTMAAVPYYEAFTQDQ